jgi:hypothetical protein
MSLSHGIKRIVTDGLVLALDASNTKSYPGSGTLWSDISGNGRDFTWGGAQTFTSASAGSSIDTSGAFIATGPASNSFGITNTSGYTIFMIAKQNALIAAAGFKFYSGVSGATARGIFAHSTWSNGDLYFDQGGGSTAGTQRMQVSSADPLAWNIWVFQRDTGGSTRRIYENGNLLITEVATAADINLTSTPATIAGDDQYTGWDANFAGFLAYSRGLTEAEILQNTEALRARFGI